MKANKALIFLGSSVLALQKEPAIKFFCGFLTKHLPIPIELEVSETDFLDCPASLKFQNVINGYWNEVSHMLFPISAPSFPLEFSAPSLPFEADIFFSLSRGRRKSWVTDILKNYIPLEEICVVNACNFLRGL